MRRTSALCLPSALLLVACGEEPCPEGSSREADGLCHQDDHGADPADDTGEPTGDDGGTGADDGGGDEGGGDEGGGDEGGDEGGGDEGGGDDGTEDLGIAILGGGSHSLEGIEMVAVATASEDLYEPRDLDFNPDRPEELWVVNYGDSTATIIWDIGTAEQTHQYFEGLGRLHWLATPSGISFSDNGNLGTSHDSSGEQETGGGGDPPALLDPEHDPASAMGPSLWPSDLEIFDGGQAGHIDMVHDAAFSGGIEAITENRFWVHDGYHGSLSYYDFRVPHEPGGTDHEDAIIIRCALGEVSYLEGVAHHMALDDETGWLYQADPANGVVNRLDTATLVVDDFDGDNDDGGGKHNAIDTHVEAWQSGEELLTPAGMEIHEGHLFLTDHGTGHVLAYDLDTGELVDWLDTELGDGVLQGLTFDASGNLYLVDGRDSQILRVSISE